MGEVTAIEWCDHTWNPWMGCQKVGKPCDFCYAEELAPGPQHLPPPRHKETRPSTKLRRAIYGDGD